MSGVIGGLVAYEDGVKKGEEYAPPKKVRVELKFDVEPGQDSQVVLNRVSHMAMAKCAEMLGLKTMTAPVAVKTTTAPAETAPAEAAAKPIDDDPMGLNAPAPAAAEPAKRTRRTKAQIEADELAKSQGQPFHPVRDPAAVVDVAPAEPAASEASPSVDLTDRGLLSAVTDINNRIKKAPEITKIILKYCPTDGAAPSLKRIPEDKRQAFMAELTTWAATQPSAG